MRISCVYRTNSRELKTESQWNASATTILFRITTLTSDNSPTASGPIWQVSKETTRTSLRARVLARCRKWIFQELNKGPRRRNNRILNLHTSRPWQKHSRATVIPLPSQPGARVHLEMSVVRNGTHRIDSRPLRHKKRGLPVRRSV